MVPTYKKGRKNDLGNYRPVSLISVLGKVMDQIILSAIAQHMQDNQGIRPRQLGIMKDMSCLTDLISFYDKVTHLMDEGKALQTLVKPLTPSPTALFWKKWLLMAWTGVLYTG